MRFRQKFAILILAPPYRVRTIDNAEDLQKIIDLRRSCFPGLAQNISIFDQEADHLIVEDLEKKCICGAYRISYSQISTHFQIEEDFEVHSILSKPGEKLELAWAWVLPEYRHGTVVSLLWRGISDLIRQTQARYIFGITSIQEDQISNVALIREILKTYDLGLTDIKPHDEKACPHLEKLVGDLRPLNKAKARRLLPGLLRTYILAGAMVCNQPSFDADLACFDFLTVIEANQLTDGFNHHFKLNEPELVNC